jgi:hypothetical protein
LKFCKILLNLKSSTPNYMVYGWTRQVSNWYWYKRKDNFILGKTFKW